MAIVHDHLLITGGAERVFQYICEEFPEADVYTLAYNPLKTYPFFLTKKIRTTFLNSLIQSMESFKWLFPVATSAMQLIDLREYDIVLSSSTTVAKFIRVPNGIHICYCFMPSRAIWQFEEYFGKGVKRKFIKLFLPYLQKRDYYAAQQVNQFIAISQTTKKYILQYYQREAKVLFSPIDLEVFIPSAPKKDHYLIVSRLEHWKRVDYAIEAFNILGLQLRIIGTGSDEARLKAMAKSNIKFLGNVDNKTLVMEYSEALAVIFTPLLEYGLTPLEAIACGTPVICLGLSGINETMINWKENENCEEPATAIFFYEQTADALIGAVKQFNKSKFNSIQLLRHASKWGVPIFKKNIRQLVNFYIDSSK